MADELTISASGTYYKNGVRRNFTADSLQVDVSGDGMINNVQEITAVAGGEAIELGDVATPGWARFKNLDDTNFIEIGFDDTGFVTFLKLLAGEETGWIRLSQAAPYAQADTAACLLEYTIIDT